MTAEAAVGNRRTHKKERQRLRRRLEARGSSEEEVAAAVAVMRARQLERRAPLAEAKQAEYAKARRDRRALTACIASRAGLHAWRYGNGERRCRNCGDVQKVTWRSNGAHTRALLRKRDGDLCALCHEPCMEDDEDDPATIDHVIPKVDGGSDALENLQLAHESCNNLRGQSQDPKVDGRTGRPHRASA